MLKQKDRIDLYNRYIKTIHQKKITGNIIKKHEILFKVGHLPRCVV